MKHDPACAAPAMRPHAHTHTTLYLHLDGIYSRQCTARLEARLGRVVSVRVVYYVCLIYMPSPVCREFRDELAVSVVIV